MSRLPGPNLPRLWSLGFKGAGQNANQKSASSVYDAIVAQARQTDFYSRRQVPDSLSGRFEMIIIHMFLVQQRLKDSGAAADKLGRSLLEVCFDDLDVVVRETGVGDKGVPRRIHKMTERLYGRAEVYGAAMTADDRQALATHLLRNIHEDDPSCAGECVHIADYMFAARAHLADIADADLIGGKLSFPPVDV